MNRWALLLLLAPLSGAAAPVPSELARELRSPALDPAACYKIRDLSIFREDLKLYFNEGYLIFSKPVNGERISAVFYGEVEGGDGEVLLLPPYRGERLSLLRFTQSPNLDEHFREAILVFSDDSAKALLKSIEDGSSKASPEVGAALALEWTPALANVQSGFELRMLADLLTPPADRPGLFFAALAGKRLGNFEVYYDRRASNQVAVGRQASSDKHYAYDVWTAFPARSYRDGSAKLIPAQLAEKRFQIDAALDANLSLKATTHLSIETGPRDLPAVSFEVSGAVRILSARTDGQPADLLFADGLRAAPESQNISFLVIPKTPLAASRPHEIEFEEQGSVITPAGNGVYFVGARSNWYPRASTGLALYDLTFRYPSRLTLVTPGEIVEDRIDSDAHVTRRSTSVPIRFAGFNLGDYAKATSSVAGVRIDVYGNRQLENALVPRPPVVEETLPPPRARRTLPQHGELRPPAPAPNPLSRLQGVAADVSSALQFFSALFGSPPLKNLTVSPIPGPFGQGFPGLVYLSTLSYLDPNQRPEGLRGTREQLFFSDLIEAHEVAHQWWGDVVMPESYQDEWLSEALATYSALLYLESKKGSKAMQDVLEDYRDTLIKKDENGATLESAGPITWGFRLENTGSEVAWHDITYFKGAWVLHMLRQRLGDSVFLKMLAELRRLYDSKTLSTAQFAALVKEIARSRAPGSRTKAFDVDEFFENWVYGTGIPELKLSYSISGLAPAVRVSGSVLQSGVEDGFSTQVPVEIQFAKGAPQTVWVDTSNGESGFSVIVRQTPQKVSIPDGRAVLATRK